MKIFKSYYSLLFGLLGFLPLFSPGLNKHGTVIFSLCFSSIYFLAYSVLFKRKYDQSLSESDVLSICMGEKEEQIVRLEEFVHKRKLFRSHDMPGVIKISSTELGYIRDKYRGSRYESIISDFRDTQAKCEEVLRKEMRDFDEQLFYIQSDKNN